MKIVYCVPSLAISGGLDKVITYKANFLANVLNYDVTIITLDQHNRPPFYKISDKVKFVDLRLDEFKLTRYAFLNMFLHWSWTRKSYNQYKKYWKQLVADNDTDIVISAFPGNASFLYKLGGTKQFIFEQHCSVDRFRWHSNNFFRKIHAKYAQYKEVTLCKHYDRVVLLTDEERQRYWSAYSNVEVIPNPITLPETKIANLSLKRVIAVGRFSKQKGFPLLVKAWSLIEKEFPDWKLSIVGDQTDIIEVEKVKSEMESLGTKNIELLPATKDIVKEYATSSIFVLSSLYEGFGLVLTEAMACGLPCVSFKCHCGPKDIITDGVDGFLVELGDIKGLAESMKKLMSDDALRMEMGKNALKKSEKFSLPSVMERWDKLFKELIQ